MTSFRVHASACRLKRYRLASPPPCALPAPVPQLTRCLPLGLCSANQVFATPKRHHKSKPFFDHVISFAVADGRIWMRNYQVRVWTVVPGFVPHQLNFLQRIISSAVADGCISVQNYQVRVWTVGLG